MYSPKDMFFCECILSCLCLTFWRYKIVAHLAFHHCQTATPFFTGRKIQKFRHRAMFYDRVLGVVNHYNILLLFPLLHSLQAVIKFS